MGDFIVYLIPTELTWQPTQDAAERTANEARLLAGIPQNIYPNVEWFDRLTDLNSPNPDGFDDLTATVPCCGDVVSLADLDYDWPAGFSRFRITLWNPEHELTDEHLATLSMTLGHELRLIHAHP